MDTSKEYIKMCDCPEVQERWRPGNFTSYHAYHKRLKRVGDFIYGLQWENSDREELVWLPRQDETQEMMIVFAMDESIYNWKCHTSIMKLFSLFVIFCEVNGAKYEAFEQLWLAFYMAEKHSKFWGKKGWKESGK